MEMASETDVTAEIIMKVLLIFWKQIPDTWLSATPILPTVIWKMPVITAERMCE